MYEGHRNPDILRVLIRESETQIDFGYSADNIYSRGGWIRIDPNTHLKNQKTSNIYKMVKAEGIPIAPEKTHFNTHTDWQFFTLFFEPLPLEDQIIDFIEPEYEFIENYTNTFNFQGIKLEISEALEEFCEK